MDKKGRFSSIEVPVMRCEQNGADRKCDGTRLARQNAWAGIYVPLSFAVFPNGMLDNPSDLDLQTRKPVPIKQE